MTARSCPHPRLRIDHRDDHEDDDVVGEQDHLPPHQPVHVNGQRRRKLFDQTLIGDEDLGALEDRRVDEVPDDQAERDVGQMLFERQFEQLRVQQPHGDRRGARRDGDPERPQHRAPVALLDVLPAQVKPQLALAEPGDQVAPRAANRLRLRGGVGERHCAGLPNLFLTTHAPQPNPLHQPGGIAPRHQEVPAEPRPLLEQQPRRPGCDSR